MESFPEQSSEERKSILWSLKPVMVFSKICGIPAAIYKPRKSSCILHRVLGFIFNMIPNLICLALNSFFKMFNCLFKGAFWKLGVCKGYTGFNKAYSLQIFPLQFEILLQQLVEPLAMIGVPFIFALQFYFTGRFHKILDSVQEINEKLVLPSRFYRKCRKHCLFLIAVSLTVILLGYFLLRLNKVTFKL